MMQAHTFRLHIAIAIAYLLLRIVNIITDLTVKTIPTSLARN